MRIRRSNTGPSGRLEHKGMAAPHGKNFPREVDLTFAGSLKLAVRRRAGSLAGYWINQGRIYKSEPFGFLL